MQDEIKRPPTRSIYHLTYENACKVIEFICKKDTGAIDSDYANISVGRVHTQVNDENWQDVVNFLNDLDVRYEVTDAADTVIEKSDGYRKIADGVIKPELPANNKITQEMLEQVIEGCNVFHNWMKTQMARDIIKSNKVRKEHFQDNKRLIDICKRLLKQKYNISV